MNWFREGMIFGDDHCRKHKWMSKKDLLVELAFLRWNFSMSSCVWKLVWQVNCLLLEAWQGVMLDVQNCKNWSPYRLDYIKIHQVTVFVNIYIVIRTLTYNYNTCILRMKATMFLFRCTTSLVKYRCNNTATVFKDFLPWHQIWVNPSNWSTDFWENLSQRWSDSYESRSNPKNEKAKIINAYSQVTATFLRPRPKRYM